ncbi:MAG: ABC transporter substrate-binding protein, partial [Ilumatobacteraceae bacterium]
MALRIQPHGRLQEWVADELGYFTEEGLDYEFVAPEAVNTPISTAPRDEHGQIKFGAYETYAAGREADLSCACHWAVNTAATNDVGKLIPNIYSVTPCAIVVPPESEIRRPEDLAGVQVGVGYHSGSHFTTTQALEAVLPREAMNLSFEGSPETRLDSLVNRQIPAATVFGVELYIAESLGCRAVLDATFMVAFLTKTTGTDPDDIGKYVNGLKRAQMEIDLHGERYKHYHQLSVPAHYQDRVDVRQFGPGERIVFLPYTGETYESTQAWIQERGIFS